MSAPSLVAYAGPDVLGALYVDGKLDKVGTRPQIEARVAEIVGLEIRTGDDFLRGTAAEVAPTLDSIAAWLDERARGRAEVERMRAEAQGLLREAARMAEVYK